MTNILRQILPNHQAVRKLHLEIENKPFLLRYLGKSSSHLSLLDHYRHLRQLKSIYDTFSELMTSPEFTPKLPDSLSGLLQRGAHIEQDLDFLSPHVSAKNKDDILESTKCYIAHLRQIPLEHGSANNNELLINFLVSILGDLNGGQFLKNFVRGLYQKLDLYSDDAPDNGVRFYCFEKDTAANLTAWLKSFLEFHDPQAEQPAVYSDNANLMGKGAVDAFTMQSAIVDELEQPCGNQAALKRHSIFSCNSGWKVAAVATAAGVALSVILKVSI